MPRYGYQLLIAALLTGLTATTGCATPSGNRSGASLTGSGVKYGKGVNRLGHAIQMGAFSEVKNAERFTAMLQAKGIEAFYFRRDNGIYAVRFGDFRTKEQARNVAQRLVRDGLISSYYIAPPSQVVFTAPKQVPERSSTRLPSWQAAPPPEIRETRPASTSERDMGFIAARTAERFIGIPYQWGGNTVVDGLDCSGFVRAVYNLCGVSIPRTSREQYKAGTPIDRADLKDGDLVFFGSSEATINHVGIYVGNGMFVHAPKRGEDIKSVALTESYFERRFVGARRYFP